MKILITGSSGFVARHLQKNFLKNKRIKLFFITRKKTRKKNFIRLDMSKITEFKKKNLSFDFVIHTAFLKKKNKTQMFKKLQLNFRISENLIKILKNINFKKVINLSSSSLYPNISGKFQENSKINFIKNSDFDYALAKYYTEKIIDNNFPKKKILHLRVGQIFGGTQEMNIISDMKRSLIQKNFIEIFGDGSRKISIIHISKLFKYIILGIKKKLSGVYNISDYTISTNQIANYLKKKYGDKYTKINYKKKIIDNSKFNLISEKFFMKANIKKPKLSEFFNEI